MPLVELQTIKQNHKRYRNYKTTKNSSESFEKTSNFSEVELRNPSLSQINCHCLWERANKNIGYTDLQKVESTDSLSQRCQQNY